VDWRFTSGEGSVFDCELPGFGRSPGATSPPLFPRRSSVLAGKTPREEACDLRFYTPMLRASTISPLKLRASLGVWRRWNLWGWLLGYAHAVFLYLRRLIPQSGAHCHHGGVGPPLAAVQESAPSRRPHRDALGPLFGRVATPTGLPTRHSPPRTSDARDAMYVFNVCRAQRRRAGPRDVTPGRNQLGLFQKKSSSGAG